jgi:Plavaka transposase
MFVCIVAGSDKTVASVATGHQEFHPVYIGPGNIDNPTRRAHGNGILPCAFLPIPKGIFAEYFNIRGLIVLFFSLKLARRREKRSHINNFAANYFMRVWLTFMNLLSLLCHLQRLLVVRMVIFAD